MYSWCESLDDEKIITTEQLENWSNAHWSSKLAKPSTFNRNRWKWNHFLKSVQNLGVSFGDKLSIKQVNKVCQSAYLELRRISSVRHVLTVDATKTLVTSLVLSRLHYCNSLLSGMPQQLIEKLQKVHNCSPRLIFKTSERSQASPLLTKLHWLPIAQRIEYKASSLCYDVVSETAPPYLSDLLRLYIPSRLLRSSADTRTFQISKTKEKKKFQGRRTFPHLGPS